MGHENIVSSLLRRSGYETELIPLINVTFSLQCVRDITLYPFPCYARCISINITFPSRICVVFEKIMSIPHNSRSQLITRDVLTTEFIGYNGNVLTVREGLCNKSTLKC
jgi:hypothetical protein